MRGGRERGRGQAQTAATPSHPAPRPQPSPDGIYLVDTDALPSPDAIVDAPDAVAAAAPSRPFFVEATYATDGAGSPIDAEPGAAPAAQASDAPIPSPLDAAGDAGWAEPGEIDRDGTDNAPPSDLV